jgi:hypothetical protein
MLKILPRRFYTQQPGEVFRGVGARILCPRRHAGETIRHADPASPGYIASEKKASLHI